MLGFRIRTHLEEVIASHARLARNTSRDNDSVGTSQSSIDVVATVSTDS